MELFDLSGEVAVVIGATGVLGGAMQASSAGFHPLWSPPTTEVQTDTDDTKANYRIHLILLGGELGIVLLVVNGAVYLLKDKPPASAKD